MLNLDWHGLYAESWGADLVPDAYAHPAKMARGLIRQIYVYMLEQGMIAPGDVIGDPFGGVACGALDAMRNGLHWRGCELEPRFVEMGNQNIGLWLGRYAAHFRGWGTAVLVQGDSRQFAEVGGGLGAVVSSPPYADAVKAGGEGPGAYGPDNAAFKRLGKYEKGANASNLTEHYGTTPGQLGAMPAGDLDAVTYHYACECGWTGTTRVKTCPACGSVGSVVATSGDLDAAIALDACVSSPPFEASLNNSVERSGLESHGKLTDKSKQYHDYGDTLGNIGNDTGATFWQASRAIVEQVYLALKPGGYVAWITGDFVRKGQRVEFGRQWMTLCEACGFEPVAWAVAWKTEYNGTQTGFFEDVEKRKDRVSFFRRLANEKNPDAAILNEDVIFMRRLG